MNQLNLEIKDPSNLWENILQYYKVSNSPNEFDLSEKYGSGFYSFKKISANIQYLQFQIRLAHPVKFNFFYTEDAKNFKMLLFHKGSSNSVRFLPDNVYTNTTKPIPRFNEDQTNYSCHFLSQFSDLPNFIINKDENCIFHLLFLDQDALDTMLPDNANLNFQEPIYSSRSSSEIIGYNKVVCFDKLFNSLHTYHDEYNGNKFNKLGNFLKLLGDYFIIIRSLKKTLPKEASALHDKDFKKLIQIEQRLHQTLTSNSPSLKSLAAEFGISKTKMCGDFKAFYGKGILTYYNDLKLELAKELISTSGQSMKEIADELTFSNQSNCTKWFKKNTGITPRKYRLSKRKPGF